MLSTRIDTKAFLWDESYDTAGRASRILIGEVTVCT